MIPNHTQYLEALEEHRKVRVKFYSTSDSGVLDHVCAPLSYGSRSEGSDALHRYWLWDYASDTGVYTLGLAPQQIVDLQVLGEKFDPAEFASALDSVPGSPENGLPPAPVASDGGPASPGL